MALEDIDYDKLCQRHLDLKQGVVPRSNHREEQIGLYDLAELCTECIAFMKAARNKAQVSAALHEGRVAPILDWPPEALAAMNARAGEEPGAPVLAIPGSAVGLRTYEDDEDDEALDEAEAFTGMSSQQRIAAMRARREVRPAV